MSDAASLSQFVQVRQQFLRSIHVERDYRSSSTPSFYMTECAGQALEAAASALTVPAHRAMAIVGPYGSGKSAFCVLLANLVSQKWQKTPAANAKDLDIAATYSEFRKLSPLVPVLLVGSRRPLGTALATALVQSLEQAGLTNALQTLRQEFGPALERHDLSPRKIADLFLAASHLVQESHKPAGLLLVIDEMGKFLEYSVLHPEQGDIFVLQELAEAAVRSPQNNPLLVLTVTHQSPEAYAQKLGSAAQAEWTKIGERFQQVPFFPSDRERLDLIGRCLKHDERVKLPSAFSEISQDCLSRGLTPAGQYATFPAIAHSSYPLHPVTLLALPALFRRIGQSHRSVFNFMSGQEQNTLGTFLEDAVYDALCPPLYSLDKLFDYASETLISGASNPGVSRFWAEASEAVDRAERLSVLGRRVLKCIAVLWLLKDSRLIPSQEVLELALRDGSGQSVDLTEALIELEQRRLIIFIGTPARQQIAESLGGHGTTVATNRDVRPPTSDTENRCEPLLGKQAQSLRPSPSSPAQAPQAYRLRNTMRGSKRLIFVRKYVMAP